MAVASFSKELKLHNLSENYDLLSSITLNTEKRSFGRITWSGDGKWLVVSPLQKCSPLPVIKLADNQLTPIRYISLSSVTSASFLNWTNRNVVVGNEGGEIFLWNIKEKKKSVEVDSKKGKSIDFLSINSDDQYIASASLNSNEINLHGLKTNKLVGSFSIPESAHTSTLCFSKTKKNYLAASSFESTICIYDIIKSDCIFKCLKAHLGTCMDVSFSPVNNSLIASVALTKTLKLYDWREKKSILESNMNESLTCIDFISSGDKLLLGTTTGNVITYDLRSSKISHVLKAQNESVLSVKCQPVKVLTAYEDVDINTPEITEEQNKILDLSVMDVLSPIMLPESARKSVNNSLIYGSFQSTPRLGLSKSDSIQEDSFLSKVMSPITSTIKTSNSFLMQPQSSPNNFSINETQIIRTVKKMSIGNKELPVIEERSFITENGIEGFGDGAHVSKALDLNQCFKDIMSELKSIKNQQEESLKEINALKNRQEESSKEISALKEELKNFKIGLLKDIQEGDWDAKIEHISQRILINQVNDNMLEGFQHVDEEMNLNKLRVTHIYKMLDDLIK